MTGGIHRGTVPHSPERAVRLAGALAELGITEITVGTKTFRARATDLPTQLESAPQGASLVAPKTSLVISLGPGEWLWVCDIDLGAML